METLTKKQQENHNNWYIIDRFFESYTKKVFDWIFYQKKELNVKNI